MTVLPTDEDELLARMAPKPQLLCDSCQRPFAGLHLVELVEIVGIGTAATVGFMVCSGCLP